jgi:peptide deformylase
MSILKVARMGHPVLRARAKPLEPGDIKSPRIQQLIDDMFETMQEYQGVGLAAPQVHASLRLFVAGLAPRADGDEGDGEEEDGEEEDGEEEDRIPLMALINPEITIVGDDTAADWEGCLSIPDIRGRVTRAREIKVKAFDRRGRRIEIDARGFMARVIQHETDHLDGVLFFDRMESFETLTFLEEFSKYWSRGRDVREE